MHILDTNSGIVHGMARYAIGEMSFCQKVTFRNYDIAETIMPMTCDECIVTHELLNAANTSEIEPDEDDLLDAENFGASYDISDLLDEDNDYEPESNGIDDFNSYNPYDKEYDVP